MAALFAVLALCGTAIFLWMRAETLFVKILELAEKRHAVTSRPPLPRDDPPPADLLQMALGESDGWARDDALKALFEMHSDLGDWGRVRAHYITRFMGN